MILEFKTSNKNTYRHRKYLAINTTKGIFTTYCPHMVIDGVEIKTKDYNKMITELKKNGFYQASSADEFYRLTNN